MLLFLLSLLSTLTGHFVSYSVQLLVNAEGYFTFTVCNNCFILSYFLLFIWLYSCTIYSYLFHNVLLIFNIFKTPSRRSTTHFVACSSANENQASDSEVITRHSDRLTWWGWPAALGGGILPVSYTCVEDRAYWCQGSEVNGGEHNGSNARAALHTDTQRPLYWLPAASDDDVPNKVATWSQQHVWLCVTVWHVWKVESRVFWVTALTECLWSSNFTVFISFIWTG